MKIKEVANVNYCATVAQVQNIIKLDNCDNVQAAIVCNQQVIVSKDTEVGDVGVFFPIETQLSQEFLSANNLYRHKERNVNQDKTGYFEDNGRLKAVKFRGHKSEGLFMPLSCLEFIKPNLELEVGTDFDELLDIPICKKYTVKRRGGNLGGPKGKDRVVRKSRMVDNQFRLHIDTAQLKKNVSMINPDDLISITAKLHGTSAVFGNVLVKRHLSYVERICRLLGVKVKETEYDLVYSSRKVIKNEHFQDKNQESYYEKNIWAEWASKLKSFDMIPKGMTLYGEIVGYVGKDSMIQKGYHYGCPNGISELYIYRITQTDVDGNVTELTRPEIDEYCTRTGLNATPLYYYGKARDLYPELDVSDHWHEELITKLEQESDWGMNDVMCKMNNMEVPSEGVVLRLERMYNPTPLKLKNYKFLQWETKLLDKGEVDMEEEN